MIINEDLIGGVLTLMAFISGVVSAVVVYFISYLSLKSVVYSIYGAIIAFWVRSIL